MHFHVSMHAHTNNQHIEFLYIFLIDWPINQLINLFVARFTIYVDCPCIGTNQFALFALREMRTRTIDFIQSQNMHLCNEHEHSCDMFGFGFDFRFYQSIAAHSNENRSNFARIENQSETNGQSTFRFCIVYCKYIYKYYSLTYLHTSHKHSSTSFQVDSFAANLLSSNQNTYTMLIEAMVLSR